MRPEREQRTGLVRFCKLLHGLLFFTLREIRSHSRVVCRRMSDSIQLKVKNIAAVAVSRVGGTQVSVKTERNKNLLESD